MSDNSLEYNESKIVDAYYIREYRAMNLKH